MFCRFIHVRHHHNHQPHRHQSDSFHDFLFYLQRHERKRILLIFRLQMNHLQDTKCNLDSDLRIVENWEEMRIVMMMFGLLNESRTPNLINER